MTEKERCQDTQGRSSQEDRGRDCSDVSTSQRTPRIADNHQRLGRSKLGLAPRSLRKHGLTEHLDFALLDSRIVKEHMSNEASHPLCGTLLQPPWETIVPTEDTSGQIYLSFFTELLQRKAVVNVSCKPSLARSSADQGTDPWVRCNSPVREHLSWTRRTLPWRDNIFSKDSSTCFHAVGVNVRSKGETPLCG